MGTITREGTAPIARGDTSSGTELEAEINKIHTLINGNIDNANVAADADISGTKLGNATLTAGRIADSTITGARFAAETFSKVVKTSDFSSTTVVTPAWTTIESRDITTSDGPGPVLISATMVWAREGSPANYPNREPFNPGLFRVRLLRDGGDLFSAQYFMGCDAERAYGQRWTGTGFWLDETATANTTHTYTLQGFWTYSGTIYVLNVYDVVLSCLEFR